MSEQLEKEVYLGDGAYAKFSNYDVEVYASNGVEVHDKVFLEPDALRKLFTAAKERGLL